MNTHERISNHLGKVSFKGSACAYYDMIVVGSDSAGAVLARGRSDLVNLRVLLLELGRAYQPWAFPPEVSIIDFAGDVTGVDWGYRTEPRWTSRPIGAARGKRLGGSSANIDALVGLDGHVQGVVVLSVIDTSIFPETISVATNVTTIALAKHFAARMN